MTKRLVVSSVLLIVTCGLAGCDTFHQVRLTPHHNTGAVLTSPGAKDVDGLADAVRKVAAQNQLTCQDHPKPDVRVACGPWFHNLSVTQPGGIPTIELHLAHPGWDLGHDRDCDQIDEWIRNLQTLLGELDVISTLGSCR
ncbi:MAG TPA: hypothetical protein VF117_05760 [Gammaproteobacteria bacterium]